MATQNLYWPVYKNLEKEFLQVADYIHFSDDQLSVYSMHIADLIMRCAVEIEAIAKELYEQNGGNMAPVDEAGNPRDLYFDTDCLGFLEQKWQLSKKKIVVSAANFYFTDEANKTLTPLHKAYKRGSSGSKWKQAYQAVKHDRKKSLKKATVLNLLHAMGALFILNLYYKNERIDIGRVYMSDHDFDSSAGSEIFSVWYCQATMLSMSEHMDDTNIESEIREILDKAIYILKYDDKSFRKMHEDFCRDRMVSIERFNSSPEIIKYLSEHPECADKSINEICMEAGGIELLQRMLYFGHTQAERSVRMEAMLNTHDGIYPELFPLEKP